MLIRLSLILALLFALPCPAEEPQETFRIWTAVSGAKLTARLVKNTKQFVTLEKTDGALVRIPVSRLSRADRELIGVATTPAAQPAATDTKPPSSPGVTPDKPQVSEARFMALNRKTCLRCHRKTCATLDSLLKARWLVPGKPEQSPHYKIIGRNRKKGGTYHNLTTSQKQLVYDFILNYKP